MPGVKFIAPVFEASGYAAAARNYILALYEQGYPVTVHPVEFTCPKSDLGAEGELLRTLVDKKISHDKVIAHCTPDAWRSVLRHEEGKYIIGLTTWETDRLHPIWTSSCNRVQEVWVPSQWNVDVFRKSGVEVPIYRVPHALSADESGALKPLAIDGVHDDDFMFYAIFHWQERKNPAELLEVYLSTFAGENSVVLVLKTYLQHPSENPEEINAMVREIKADVNVMRYPRVIPMVQNLSHLDMQRLHRRGDCFALLQRAEGWGLPHFDAAAAGRPVITTGYGGQTDFLNADNSYLIDYQLRPVTRMRWTPYYKADGHWAAPDLHQAAKVMRHVFDHREEAKERGRRAQARVEQEFSRSVVGRLMVDRLRKIDLGIAANS